MVGDDPHSVCQGGSPFGAQKLYLLLLSTIARKPFLRIVERKIDSGIICIISDRPEDPRGIIEIVISPSTRHPGSDFSIRTTDDDFLSKVHQQGWKSVYGPDVGDEDTLWGIITEDKCSEEVKYLESREEQLK